MFGIHKPRNLWWLRDTAIVLAALLLGLLWITQANAADSPVSRKTARQIGVMERIIDEVLVDSPNFLVHGRENARGLYIEELGVLVTFDASLVRGGKSDYSRILGKWGEGFRIETESDGSRVLIIQDPEDGDEDIEELEDQDDAAEEVRSWRDRERSREERLYKRGKAEIVDVLLDYGDTLTTLSDDQWVAIVAFLRDNALFEEKKISKLVLKAKLADLRAYASEEISEEEMIKRIVEQAY